MDRVKNIIRKYGFEALVVIAAGVSALEAVMQSNSIATSQTTVWFAVPAIALIVLSLIAYRRFPFAASAAVWVLAASLSFVDGPLVTRTITVTMAGTIASFLLGKLSDAVQARIGLVIVVSGAAIAVYNSPGHTPGNFVFIPIQFAMAWLAGFAVRGHAAQAEAAEERAIHMEREREATARIAVAEERARIARELHDVVAHAVSVMVLQVGAVRHRLPIAVKDDKDALEQVERVGRTALTEMRNLLGAMRHDGDALELAPQPGLDSLNSLLEDVGRAGLPVRLHVDGDPLSLPRAIDLSAYRIVQEGLTNVLKHARADRADVFIHYKPNEVHIEVRDDGEGSLKAVGSGSGLVGVRERVKIYGGEMSAGPAPKGGFVLRTRLPIGGDFR